MFCSHTVQYAYVMPQQDCRCLPLQWNGDHAIQSAWERRVQSTCGTRGESKTRSRANSLAAILVLGLSLPEDGCARNWIHDARRARFR